MSGDLDRAISRQPGIGRGPEDRPERSIHRPGPCGTAFAPEDLSSRSPVAAQCNSAHRVHPTVTALGGDADVLEVEAYVLSLLIADPYQHDLLAQALNEWCLARGGDHPVAYWRSGAIR
jgi:hypothetical protein